MTKNNPFDFVKEFKILTKIMKKLKISEMILKGLDGKVEFSSKPLSYCRITGEFRDVSSGFLKEISDKGLGLILKLEDMVEISKTLKKDALSVDFSDNSFILTTTEKTFEISFSNVEIETLQYEFEQEISLDGELIEVYMKDNNILTRKKTPNKILEIHSKKVLVIIDDFKQSLISFNNIEDGYRLLSVSVLYGEDYKNAKFSQHFITV